MRPFIFLLGLPLFAATLCLSVGCQPSSQSSSLRDSRLVGKWVETGHGGALELRSDGMGEMKDKSGGTASFAWATEGEKLTISGLSAPSSVWPPKEESYGYLYRASEQIRGAAFLEVTSADGKTSWSMDRP